MLRQDQRSDNNYRRKHESTTNNNSVGVDQPGSSIVPLNMKEKGMIGDIAAQRVRINGNKEEFEKHSVSDTATTEHSDSSSVTVHPQKQQLLLFNALAPVSLKYEDSSIPSSSNLQLLLKQVQLLATAAALFFVLYLFLHLQFWTFVVLLLFLVSTSLLIYTLYLYSVRWCSATILPPIQKYFTDATVHSWMMDSSLSLEYRYLLLYFIPGITEQQLLALLERLPDRHRLLLRERVGKLFFPDWILDFLSLHTNTQEEEKTNITMRDAASAIMRNFLTLSSPSQLKNDEQELMILQREINGDNIVVNQSDMEWFNDDNGDDRPVDIIASDSCASAVPSTRRHSSSFSHLNGESDLGLNRTGGGEMTSVIMSTNHMDWLTRVLRPYRDGQRISAHNNNNSEEGRESFAHLKAPVVLRNNEPVMQKSNLMESSRALETTTPKTTRSKLQSEEEKRQSEQEVEGQIISDAISTMMGNYVNSTLVAITDVADNFVKGSFPMWIVRGGVGTCALAGLGLFGNWYLRLYYYHDSSSSRSRDGQYATTLRREHYAAYYGLVCTMVVSGVSASAMILARNVVNSAALVARSRVASSLDKGELEGGNETMKREEKSKS